MGAPLKGKKVLIVDDVVTAGTAKREAIGKILAEGGEVAGIGMPFISSFVDTFWKQKLTMNSCRVG